MLSAVLPAEWVVRRCPLKLPAGYFAIKINDLREIGLPAETACPPKTGNIIKTMT
jgi:hypothetical protein